MERLPHGYTNVTSRTGGVVVKAYRGPEAVARAERESRALTALAGRVPVPPLIGSDPGQIRTGWVAGRHGQDEIADGHAVRVLRACGAVLRSIQAVDPATVFPEAAGAGVLAHGDFGPNNVLLAPDFTVTAVVDWEWVHIGEPVADLAWCEWILRMHHAADVEALPALFAGYGRQPPWPERQAAMVARCSELLEFTRRWESGGAGVRQWTERLAVTSGWSA